MNFGIAFEEIKKGNRVARSGWNGAGQFVYLQSNLVDSKCLLTESTKFEPVLVIKNAQGKHQPGWLPSIGDLMAEDWEVV